MEDLQHSYNFNDPLELIEIFRATDNSGDTKLKEYSGKVSINWEDIKLVKEYPYEDNWETHKGEKFYLTLYNYPHDLLILGSYGAITKQRRILRNEYPIFEKEGDE